MDHITRKAPGNAQTMTRGRGGVGRRYLRATLIGFAGMAAVATGAGNANAGVVHNNWNYAIDSFNDGSGGSGFEERGLAFRQIGQTGHFAISGDMLLTGTPYPARNGSVALGDLFLNFTSDALDAQGKFTDPAVFGIRFTASNDSFGNIGGSNTSLGLFRNITVVDLAAPQNGGYDTLQAYYNAGFGRPTRSMGDRATTTDVISYLGNGDMYANMASGTLVAGITSLSTIELGNLGLDFAHFGPGAVGTAPLIGFSVDLSALPRGQFTAHFFEECINDGIALRGQVVPEPSTFALLGIALAGVTRYRRRQE
ncbi:MAG TPA: PEP-CTERM sorting domain-containing protein [Accumulibacter sp.]|uniref:PEP-CTERM sorting domain-containing protein n=1 Tax=Accumulibacter sp. TaxID=2053492 RepID=UPI002C988C2E|nr:PEP-CTERM sorting domain-containing protein [Accumulibacter sp.]HRD89849.1 PEP-CTERM sorting domain-containing protein [Accumulibacter sp.]